LAGVIQERAYILKQQKGELAKKGFFWTTRYLKKYEKFFEEKRVKKPDGHIECEGLDLLCTVEITKNPEKPNLIDQLHFYCSDTYGNRIVDKGYHEVWIFIPYSILKDFIEMFGESTENLSSEKQTPIVIYSIDFDRKRLKYIIKQEKGSHYSFIEKNQNLNLGKLECNIPSSPLLLSDNLPVPTIMADIGRKFLSLIQNPPPKKTISEIYEKEEIPYGITFKKFKKCIGYLSILCPRLLDIEKKDGEELVRIKQNVEYIREIKKQLEKISRKKNENEIKEWVKEVIETQKKERGKKRRKRKLHPTQATLFECLDETDKFME